jgi:hypothetical protein
MPLDRVHCNSGHLEDQEGERIMVKLSLALIHSASRLEDVWGSGGIAPQFLTSALGRSEWSAWRPCRFTSREKALGTHCIGGWVGPRVGLNVMEKRKISCPYREWNPDSSAVHPVAYSLQWPSYPGSRRRYGGILKPVSEPGYFVASWWLTPLRHPPKVTIDQ